MAGIALKLRSLYDVLPWAERRAADYYLGRPAEALRESIHTWSRAAGVSAASIGRLAKKTGCRDFKEFKIALAQETAASPSAVLGQITAQDRDDAIVKKIFGANIQSLEDTLATLNVAELARAARDINRAALVVFLGIGSSGIIAQDAAFRFAHLGIPTEGCGDPYHLLVRSLTMRRKTVVIGISHSGRSVPTIRSLAAAGRNGAMTVGISNYPASPLKAVCRLFFCTSFRENKVRATAVSSRLSQIGLIDALYGLVARHRRILPPPQVLDGLIDRNFRVNESRRRRTETEAARD